MTETTILPTDPANSRTRLLEAMHLQEIEANPLTPDEIAMFAMFEREGWSPEKCRAYILAQLKTTDADAAE